ncbi:MFS transporter [Neptuniibacter sp. CAU 1671]|uniref:MFS transporter n=1 Tax=Neptuniibacter sp. CAU 1671 TaxID=3032593 RepID=UPI0023DA1A9B|nr:MFS transporter [Neptuniibacter sp. CAU 1671]MDF2182002.1 MFS transporter [Neptuniibacter sp. CAU 1671]
MNRNVYLLSACQALLVCGNVLLVSVVALIGQQLSPAPLLITLPVALQFAGLMLATVPASLIMQRVGRKKGFFLGSWMGVAGAVLAVISLLQPSFILFCCATFLLGIGIGFGTLYRFAVVEVCEPQVKSRAISMVMAGGVVAAVIGPQLAIQGQQWFTDRPYLGAFVGLLGLYLLALLLLTRTQLPEPSAQPAQGGRRLRVILAQPQCIVAIVVAAVGYMVMTLLMTATPLAMARCGFAFTHSAEVIQWHVLGMFLPSFITAKLIARWGLKTVMLLGVTLMLGCIGVNLAGVELWQFWLALVLLGVGWNFMFIGATELLTGCYTAAERGKTQAANEFLVFSMATLATFSSGALESILGWQMMNILMLPVVVWAAAVILFFLRVHQQTLSKGQHSDA